MRKNKNIYSDYPEMPGTPFDPFGNDDGYTMNARIVPSEFDFPFYPTAFSLIRNTEAKKPDTETPES